MPFLLLTQSNKCHIVGAHVMEGEGKEIGKVLDGPLAGTFEHALDPRKRVTIPAVWLEVMCSPAYVYVMPDVN